MVPSASRGLSALSLSLENLTVWGTRINLGKRDTSQDV
ncbi:unnamed protein product [Tuber aestivum]|uniref:Uncharacterized protein n=1 Tax=Tuber aestivum TaxID=59557 RepID=A0A292Q0X5_9PEZI|nr:unnamed protein product [Tuber aestivum]